MLTPKEAYQYDPTFRHIVDILRAELQVYNITPGELRQAVILAATMHEMENIKPLLIPMAKPWDGLYRSPAMFGGAPIGSLPEDKNLSSPTKKPK